MNVSHYIYPHDCSVGERMWLTLGSIPIHSKVCQGIFPWLITFCQSDLSQRGRKWPNLSSMTPLNLWTSRRLKSDNGQTMAEKTSSLLLVAKITSSPWSFSHEYVLIQISMSMPFSYNYTSFHYRNCGCRSSDAVWQCCRWCHCL